MKKSSLSLFSWTMLLGIGLMAGVVFTIVYLYGVNRVRELSIDSYSERINELESELIKLREIISAPKTTGEEERTKQLLKKIENLEKKFKEEKKKTVNPSTRLSELEMSLNKREKVLNEKESLLKQKIELLDSKERILGTKEQELKAWEKRIEEANK